MYHSETHQELVALLLQKNKEGFTIIYDKYAPTLYAILLKLVGNNATIAEDLLQESFTKIWNNVEQYEPQQGSIFTWMLQITRDNANNYLRSQHHNITEDTLAPENYIPELSNDLNKSNITLVATLEQKYIAVLDLVYLKGMQYEDAAKKLNIPVDIVKTRMQFAIQQLRNTL